ncbi:hypothetical protein K470DRAFT_919 [Piedraia hortae CBS 480.64]|uniref:DUF4267 domain-containing protein n=1 Tax=Piedraia hortae CBS 480.64 TaxID=1314780 RepID=A0A6A7C9V5_9PEZI|nr:hypothetical protein K470DRAFT_919 [Piedraia hortae CBS 480.64]
MSFQTFRAGLPPPSTAFAIAIGLVDITIFGIAGLANPREFGNAYGLPLGREHDNQQDESAQKKGYILALASRNIQNGVLLLTLGCYLRDRRALGASVAVMAISAVADAWIVGKFGVKEMVWGHVFGFCTAVGGGGWLLRGLIS